MNNLPLILLGGISAVFFLSKKSKLNTSSNKSSDLKLIANTKFPGYIIKNNKFIILNKEQSFEYATNQGNKRMSMLLDHMKEQDNKSDTLIDQYTFRYYPLIDLFGLKSNNWDDSKIYPYLDDMHSEPSIMVKSKFSKYFKINYKIINNLYLNYVIGALTKLTTEGYSPAAIKTKAESMILAWNDFLKSKYVYFPDKIITKEDLGELLQDYK